MGREVENPGALSAETTVEHGVMKIGRESDRAIRGREANTELNV